MYFDGRSGVGGGVGAVRETSLKGVTFPLPKGFAALFLGVFFAVAHPPREEGVERAEEGLVARDLSSSARLSADLFAGMDAAE